MYWSVAACGCVLHIACKIVKKYLSNFSKKNHIVKGRQATTTTLLSMTCLIRVKTSFLMFFYGFITLLCIFVCKNASKNSFDVHAISANRK